MCAPCSSRGHYEVYAVDLDCGHQVLVFACGCRCDDHDHELCDGLPVAELEESNHG